MAKIIFGKIFYYKWLLKVYWLWISSNIDFDFCRIVLLFAGYCNYGIGLYHRHVWPAMGTVSSNIGNNFFVSCPCGHKQWCCPKVCTELLLRKSCQAEFHCWVIDVVLGHTFCLLVIQLWNCSLNQRPVVHATMIFGELLSLKWLGKVWQACEFHYVLVNQLFGFKRKM